MKKFLSVACCFELIGSGIVNVGQAVEENTPKFVELTIDDDGYFHYKLSDNEGKLGVYLADFMGYGPKITLSKRSIVELGGKKEAKDVPCFKDFSRLLNEWCKRKLNYHGYQISLNDVLYLQMLALKDMSDRGVYDIRFRSIMNAMGYFRPSRSNHLNLLKIMRSQISSAKDAEGDAEGFVSEFCRVFFRGETDVDWKKEFLKDEVFSKNFVSKDTYDKHTFGLYSEGMSENELAAKVLETAIHRGDDLVKERGKSVKCKGDLDMEKRTSKKLRDDVGALNSKITAVNIFAAVGWSLLAFKCVKDWFFGESNMSPRK